MSTTPFPVETKKGQLVFDIVEDLTTPCGYCGVPSCGKPYLLWYKTTRNRPAIIFDGDLLDGAIGALLRRLGKRSLTQLLKRSAFFCEWNLGTGWIDNNEWTGTQLDSTDLLEALRLLVTDRTDEDAKVLTALLRFVDRATTKGYTVRITVC